MQLEVNGSIRSVNSHPLASLLTVLREELDITSPKPGCEQGGCGACTVLVDGQPVRSCLVPLATVESSSITTLEGIADADGLSPVQEAFYVKYGAQCGYCTSGMIVAATSLIADKGAELDDSDIVEAMEGHLCRCTGYVKIIEAVKAAASGDLSEPGGPEHRLVTTPMAAEGAVASSQGESK